MKSKVVAKNSLESRLDFLMIIQVNLVPNPIEGDKNIPDLLLLVSFYYY